MADSERVYAVVEEIRDLLSRRDSTKMSMLTTLSNMPFIPERIVDEVLTTCSRHGLHDCLILAAVRYCRIERVLCFEERWLTPELCHLLQTSLLVDLASEGLWPSWDILLSRYAESDARQLLLWLSQNHVNSEALNVFEMLLSQFVSERPLFREVIGNVVDNGFSLQYRRFLFGANNLLQHVEEGNSVLRWNIVTAVLIANLMYRTVPGAFRDSFNDNLVSTCQAGLLSAPGGISHGSVLDKTFYRVCVTPMAYAVKYNQPDVVRFLYSTGTVSDKEVFQLSRDPILASKCDRDVTAEDLAPLAPGEFPSENNVLAAREIRSFLVAKASEPRSMKSRCLAEVSKGLGWGNVRRAALKEVTIPLTLKGDLMTNCDKSLLRYKTK